MAKSAFTCTYSKRTVQSLVLPRVAGRRSDANEQQKIKYTPIEEFVVPNSQNRNDINDVIETFKVCRGVTTSANLSTNGIFYRDTK